MSCRSRSSSAATSPAAAGRTTGATGRVCGIELPEGLRESDRLPEPILTPSTKAEQGSHDENIDFTTMVTLVGAELAERVRDVALRLYGYAAAVTERAGILLADTKFEFGSSGRPASCCWSTRS